MRKGRLLPAFFLFFWCCSPPAPPPPLSEGQMIRVMADLSVAEAACKHLSGYSRDSLTDIYYRQVLELHGVRVEAYERSMQAYMKDLETMERILAGVDAAFDTLPRSQ
jgi:hypothetical protein